jgi:hypothetical protein
MYECKITVLSLIRLHLYSPVSDLSLKLCLDGVDAGGVPGKETKRNK